MDKKLVRNSLTITVTVLATVFGVYVLYRLIPLLIILVLAVLLTVVIEPAVKRLAEIRFMNRPVGRGFASILSLLTLLAVFSFILVYGLTPVFVQIQKLFMIVAQYIQSLTQDPTVPTTLSDLVSLFPTYSGGILNFTTSALSKLTLAVFAVFITVYTSIDWPNIKAKFVGLFRHEKQSEVKATLVEIEKSISHWIKGQLILMVAVGVLSYIGLRIIGIEYPLALALISGLFEIIPIVGPIVTAVLAIIVGLNHSYTMAIAAAIVFLIVQQLENNVLVPKIMQRVSGFRPLVIMISMFIGGTFFGVVGTLATVPMVMISVIVLKHLRGKL